MKKLAVVLASAAILALGTAAAAFGQTPTAPTQQWGSGHMGWGANGTYDPASNPTLKRLADKLGVSTSDLAAQIKDGRSLAEVAESKGVDSQALVDVLQAPMVDMMEIMSRYGYATQEQIDDMLQLMSERTRYSLQQEGFLGDMMGGGMMGGGGAQDFGGMMGGQRGFGGMMGGSGDMMGGAANGSGGMMGGWQNRTN